MNACTYPPQLTHTHAHAHTHTTTQSHTAHTAHDTAHGTTHTTTNTLTLTHLHTGLAYPPLTHNHTRKLSNPPFGSVAKARVYSKWATRNAARPRRKVSNGAYPCEISTIRNTNRGRGWMEGDSVGQQRAAGLGVCSHSCPSNSTSAAAAPPPYLLEARGRHLRRC